MSVVQKLVRTAQTDATFALRNGLWVGKCLICNGPIAFDARSGEGATLEHIRARSRGGSDDPENHAIVHGSCNWEKGRRWDRKQSRALEDYDQLVERLLERRRSRWRSCQ